ncbi:hypothetical protein OE319_26420, partial [Bacillus cereus]|nr:hypothetical protein [Bacillus cereus]
FIETPFNKVSLRNFSTLAHTMLSNKINPIKISCTKNLIKKNINIITRPVSTFNKRSNLLLKC